MFAGRRFAFRIRFFLLDFCIFGLIIPFIFGHYVMRPFVFIQIAGSICVFNIFLAPPLVP